MNHVCLVSDQAMPNFLPVLNAEVRPDTVTLVVSNKMRSRAQWLREAMVCQQVKVLDDIDVGDAQNDIVAVEDRLLEWAIAHEAVLNDSVLNVTGGTKPMAIAAQKVFLSVARPIFYVDINTDNLIWFSGENRGLTVSLKNQPTLRQYFALNGITSSGDFRSVVENDKWRHFYGEIAANVQKWSQSIRALNYLARLAEEKHSLAFDPRSNQMNLTNWTEFIKLLYTDELVANAQGGRVKRFVSEEARRFCNGIWLEHLVFETLKKFGFDSKRALMNVKIVDGRGNSNELDAVVLHKNTCYVIEDKTKNLKSNGSADAAVYKLAQLSSKMGLRARGILVSAIGVRPADKDRARDYGVTVIDWLPSLESELRLALGIR